MPKTNNEKLDNCFDKGLFIKESKEFFNLLISRKEPAILAGDFPVIKNPISFSDGVKWFIKIFYHFLL